jgi:iron(III) transport system ATP-binding protein
MLLKVSGISKQEGSFLLNDIRFSQRNFQRIAIAGETGSGKSTLLKIIAGLVQPDTGEVIFEKERVRGADEKLVAGHPRISYLSQHFELPKFLRVEQVLAYANTLDEHEANTLYEVCQIDHLLKRRTDQLSGGEKQRIAIARLLISTPKLLLLDEPFSHLDMVHKNTLKTVIRDIGEKLKITCILVSHDPMDTLSWADKIIIMKDGKIVQKGAPEHVYKEPVNEYVAGLFGKYNLLTPEVARALGVTPVKTKKKMIIRPEDLLIQKKGKGSKARVLQTKYFGGFCELEVKILENIITVQGGTELLKNRNFVFLSASKTGIWYLRK